MTRARNSANLASHGNLFVDITNDRTGIGSVVPDQNLHVAGTAGFHADVTFTGDLYNTTWDRSDNSLNFVDNAKIKIGTGGDLTLHHDGSHSRIRDVGTGNLNIQSNTTAIQNAAGSQNCAVFTESGAVSLYHASALKFETTAYGTNTTGTAVNDGLVVAGVATVTTMNVTGVLTYDDVTSVDSVGIITARQGVSITGGNLTLNTGQPQINFTETNGDPDYRMFVNGGLFTIEDVTNNVNKFEITGSRITLNDTVLVNDSILYIHDKIVHWGDDNTAIRFPSDDTIQLETGGSNRLVINSSGNATFSGNLTVSGNLSVTGTTTQNNSVSTAQKTITLASGAANNAAVDGAGIVIDAGSDTDKTIKWLDSTDRWTFTGGDVSANAYYGDGSNLTGVTQTTINNNANNRIITGSGTADTLEAESDLTWDGNSLDITAGTGNQFPVQIRNDFTPNIQRADYLSAANATSNNTLRLGSINSNGGVTIQSTRMNDSAQKHSLLLNPDGGQIGFGTAIVRSSRTMQLSGVSNSIFLITGNAPAVCLNRDPDDSSDSDRTYLGVSSVSNGFANGTAVGDTILRGNSTGKLLFATGTSIRARITANGCFISSNIGIGVDDRWKIRPNQSNNELAFEYSTSTSLGDGNIKMGLLSTGQIRMGNQESPSNYNSAADDIMLGNHSGSHGMTILSGTTSGGYIMFSDNNGGGANAYRGQIEYQHTDDHMRFITQSNERLRITSTGRLGINNSSPQYVMHASHNGQGGNQRIDLHMTNDTTGHNSNDGVQFGYQNSAGAYIWNFENTDIYFATNNVARLYIKNDELRNNTPFYSNTPTITQNKTLGTSYNSMSVGNITINSSITVTVQSGARWVIV